MAEEPQRALVVAETALPDGRVVQRWEYVWRHGPAAGGTVAIEHRGRMYRVPERCLAATPVPPLSQERLAALDPCFREGCAGLTELYRDDERLFSVHRCPHGNGFLEDVRGGIATYSAWVFLGPIGGAPDAGSCTDLWRRYHFLSDDALNYLGLGCPRPGEKPS